MELEVTKKVRRKRHHPSEWDDLTLGMDGDFKNRVNVVTKKSAKERNVTTLEKFDDAAIQQSNILTPQKNSQTPPVTPKKSNGEPCEEFDSDLDTPPKAKAQKAAHLKENCVKKLNGFDHGSSGYKHVDINSDGSKKFLQHLLHLVSDMGLLEPEVPEPSITDLSLLVNHNL